jgi:glutamate synthase domain-containing protein 3
MATLDAGRLTTRQLNTRLKEEAEKGAEITILNPQAAHNIGVGIFHPCKIRIEGSVGYFAASLMDGPDVTIDGNAGWGLGDNMMNGRIVLTRDASASAASSMRGGEVLIGGNAGARAGIAMKGGTLIVEGNTGFMTGFMMQKGRIIVCGDAGEAVGDSMYEGVIYVGGEIGSLGNDARVEEISEDELISIWAELEAQGIKSKPRFTKIVSEKKLYHLDSLERLEKAVL